MNGEKEDRLNVDKIAGWAHERDGVVEVQKQGKKWRVLSYEECARRLQERPKK